MPPIWGLLGIVRLIGSIVTAALGIAVIAQAAYLVKMGRRIEALEAEVVELSAAANDVAPRPLPMATRPADGEPARAGAPVVGDRPTLPLPRFVPGAPEPTATAPVGNGPALPPVLDTPEAREQLRQFIGAEMMRERAERRQRDDDRRREEQQQRIESMAKTLQLNPDETRRFTDVFARAQTARDELRARVEAGQVPGTDVGREFAALRSKTNEELRQLLGDERANKLRDMQREQRRWGGGRGPGEGGGPPPGVNPPGPGATPAVPAPP